MTTNLNNLSPGKVSDHTFKYVLVASHEHIISPFCYFLQQLTIDLQTPTLWPAIIHDGDIFMPAILIIWLLSPYVRDSHRYDVWTCSCHFIYIAYININFSSIIYIFVKHTYLLSVILLRYYFTTAFQPYYDPLLGSTHWFHTSLCAWTPPTHILTSASY